MNVLVTGAAGFLGRFVVERLLSEGHRVRVLVRRPLGLPDVAWSHRVECFIADLRTHHALADAFQGIDILLHLAAAVNADDDCKFAATVVGTERLLQAMQSSHTKRLVLASSFAVYDWQRTRRVLDEDSPLESQLYARDEYSVAKTWQERVAQRMTEANCWELTILRPGFIWGPGHEWVDGAGIRAGRFVIVNGPLRRLPLTYVENCADCFVTVVNAAQPGGGIFNVVDTDRVRAWRFLADTRGSGITRPSLVPVPYWTGYALARVASFVSRCLFGREGRLPEILIPIRHSARFRSFRFPHDKLTHKLGWQPPLSYKQALERVVRPPTRGTEVQEVFRPDCLQPLNADA